MKGIALKVLVATDGSRASEAALEHGLRLIGARQGTPPDIVVLAASRGTVAAQPAVLRPRGVLAHSMTEPSAAISHLARAREVLGAMHLAAKAVWRVGDDPVEVILETAAEEDVDLIIVGSRLRRHPQPNGLGSVSDGVLRRSRVPVLVIREPPVADSAAG